MVPTVNAVYDALMELSTKIPTITSKEIYIVSEVYTESFNYDYHTEVTQVSNYYNTYVSEFHVDQIINLSTYSGITHSKANSSTYYISGIPATYTEQGMVITHSSIESVAGAAASFTVPTVNAVFNAIDSYAVSMAGIEPIYVSSGNDKINSIGILIDSSYSGGVQLSTVVNGGSTYLVAHGQQPDATKNKLGTVYTQANLDHVTDTTSNYTVPTVNAVSQALATLNTGISEVKAISGVTVDTSKGPTVIVSGLAAATTSYGMVYVRQNINSVQGASSAYTVPTVNAVSLAITSAIYAYPLATSSTYGAVTLGQIVGLISNQITIGISTEFTSIASDVSNYVPWSAVRDVETMSSTQYHLGANFYIYKPNNTSNKTQWDLYTYNVYADGA